MNNESGTKNRGGGFGLFHLSTHWTTVRRRIDYRFIGEWEWGPVKEEDTGFWNQHYLLSRGRSKREVTSQLALICILLNMRFRFMKQIVLFYSGEVKDWESRSCKNCSTKGIMIQKIWWISKWNETSSSPSSVVPERFEGRHSWESITRTDSHHQEMREKKKSEWISSF